jgi:YD repeat-containing protein
MVVCYTYDALDRLTRDAGSTQEDEYTYDEVGNRTSKESTPITSGVPGTGITTNYSYGSTNNRLTAIGLQTVLSDAAGNLTQDRANRQLTHDARGQPAGVSIDGTVVAEFVYNALGQRTHKITTGGTSTYLYSPNGQLLGETQHDFAGAKVKSQYFVWLDALPVSVVDVAYDSLEAITSTMAH